MMRNSTLLTLLAVGCHDATFFETIVVDIAANCNEVEIIADATDLDPRDGSGIRVLDAANGHPEISGWWLLVSAPEASAEPNTLQLWHLVGDSVDIVVPLGLPPDLSHAIELRPGPRRDEAWLVRRSPGVMEVWHVDAEAEAPLMDVFSGLGGFPESNDLCPDNEFGFDARCPTTDWHRDLVFLGGTPFVVSVPPFSPDEVTWVYLAELGHGILAERALDFVSRCDPSLSLEDFGVCEERKRRSSFEEIHVLAAQHDPRTPFTSLLVLRESAQDAVRSFVPDVVVLSLGLIDGSLRGTLVKAESAQGTIPMLGSPTGLALDSFATYLLHATQDHPPSLLRLPNLGATVEPIANVRLGTDVTLMQLEGDIALSRIVEETWEITKLFPDAPEQSKVTEHRAATPIVAVEHAGPGAFIMHRSDGGPDLLRVRCVEAQ
jgi:hypothetical protein